MRQQKIFVPVIIVIILEHGIKQIPDGGVAREAWVNSIQTDERLYDGFMIVDGISKEQIHAYKNRIKMRSHPCAFLNIH